jgi:hypothetical protein
MLGEKSMTLEGTKTGHSVRPLSGAAIDTIERQDRSAPFVFVSLGNLNKASEGRYTTYAKAELCFARRRYGLSR